MNLVLKQEQFVDDQRLRNQFIDKTEVLDKVKTLSLIPTVGKMTLAMVADYYEVDDGAVKMIVHRHRDELESDGLLLCTGQELSNIKLLCKIPSNKSRSMLVFPRRAVLRVGMLLRDSPVAKQVRSYLLNIEEQSTHQQKYNATKGSSWDGLDLILYDIIHQEVMFNNGTLTSACEIASKKIGKTVKACMFRYSNHIKKTIINKDLISKIESNRTRKKVSFTNDYDAQDHGVRSVTSHELYFNAVVQMINDIRTDISKKDKEVLNALKSKVRTLRRENKSLRVQNNHLQKKYLEVSNKLQSIQESLSSIN